MNRLVKILLIILVALVIAGGGFWAGTMAGSRQAPMIAAAPAMNNLPQSGGADSTGAAPSGSSRPELKQSQQSNRPGSDYTRKSPSNNSRNDQQRTPSFNNYGPGMMSGQMPEGMMMARPNHAFGGRYNMSIGGIFMSGGMMLFGILFPLAFAVLMVLGIIVLFRMVRSQNTVPVEATAVCANCGAPIQNGWKHCPQCGNSIQ